MNTSQKLVQNRWVKYFLVLSLLVLLFLLRGATVHAQVAPPVDTGPGPTVPVGGPGYFLIAERGTNPASGFLIPLSASPAYIKISYPADPTTGKIIGGSHIINVTDGCWDGNGATEIDTGNSPTYGEGGCGLDFSTVFEVLPLDANGTPTGVACSFLGLAMGRFASINLEAPIGSPGGCGIAAGSLPGFTPQNGLYAGVMLRVRFQDASPGRENAFKLQSNGSKIGFVDTFSDPTYPGGSAPLTVSVLPFTLGANFYEYKFGSGVPCSYNPATYGNPNGNIFLRWQDADSTNAPFASPMNDDLSFDFTQYRGGVPVYKITIDKNAFGGMGGPILGGDGDFRQIQFQYQGTGIFKAFFHGQDYAGNGNGSLPGDPYDVELTAQIAAQNGGLPMTIQAGDKFEWDWHHVRGNNGIQMWSPLDSLNADIDCNAQKAPIGFADSCYLNSLGETVIRGWAYDNDSASGDGTPNVTLSISGQANKTVPSNVVNYRNPEINGYLDSDLTRFGTGAARDGQYGWEAHYTGLNQGTAYNISGSIANVGLGGPVGLGINTAAGPPVGTPGVPASYGFGAGSQLPSQCLLAPPIPRCSTINVDPAFLEVGKPVDITVTVRNDATAPAQGFSSPTVKLNISSTPGLAGLPVLDAPYRTPPPGNSPIVGAGETGSYKFTITPGAAGKWNIDAQLTGPAAWGLSHSCPTSTLLAGEIPYLKIYGNDVLAGSNFDDATGTCTVPAAVPLGIFSARDDIRGFVRSTDVANGYPGSGAQMGLMALGQIAQFRSSGVSSVAGVNPTTTAFANTTGANTFGGGGLHYGGQFGGSICAADYWKTKSAAADTSLTTPGPHAISNLTGQYYIDATAQTVQLRSNGPIRNKKAIYVKGNVFITNTGGGGQTSWRFQGAGGWTNIADMESLYLIVQGGNIYIDHDMDSLDGVYVAMPDPVTGVGGVISTCADDTGTPYAITIANGDIYNNCNNRLTINGVFIAKRVDFLRRIDSLRSARNITTEYPSAASSNCIASVTNAPVCAAEVFNFSPEVYVAPPVISPIPATDQREYDSISSLPPIF